MRCLEEGMIVRRTALVVSLIVAALITAFGVAGPAHAVDDPSSIPFGTFASPSTAPAGAPMWIKSVDPCPPVPTGWWGYVAVSILSQEQPSAATTLATVHVDLDDHDADDHRLVRSVELPAVELPATARR